MRISDWSSDVCSSDLIKSGIELRQDHEPDGVGLWRADLAPSGHAPCKRACDAEREGLSEQGDDANRCLFRTETVARQPLQHTCSGGQQRPHGRFVPVIERPGGVSAPANDYAGPSADVWLSHRGSDSGATKQREGEG